MCERCTELRNEIKADLIALLMRDPDNRLTEALEQHTDQALPALHARIDAAIESGRADEEDRPDDEEIREALRDTLLAAMLATGAATIASHTPGYTDEGRQNRSIILGEWAGTLLESEIEHQQENDANVIRHLLGMGDN